MFRNEPTGSSKAYWIFDDGHCMFFSGREGLTKEINGIRDKFWQYREIG
jgi:hypothetical protein